MIQRNVKLWTALLAVIAVAIAGIFYACNKEDSVKSLSQGSEKSLKTEIEFITKNFDETCVQVNVSRDRYNNAEFTIKDVEYDPEQTVGLMISKELDLKPLADEKVYTLEIPNDAIYWLVPLDGHKPVKFEPGNDEKGLPGSSGNIELLCSCHEWPTSCGAGNCHPKMNDKTGKQECIPDDCCTTCTASQEIQAGSAKFIFAGSTYLIKSNIITVNGITYK